MRWPDLSGERRSGPDSGAAAADRQRSEPGSLARRLDALAASHPSSPGYERDAADPDADFDHAADGADGADGEYEDPADGQAGEAGQDGDGGLERPGGKPGAGAGMRPGGAGDGDAPHPGARRLAGAPAVRGEPYRPWFSAGESPEPWFTADPGGSPG